MSLEKDQRSYLSPNAFAGGGRERNYGEETADEIDAEMRETADTAFKQPVTLLTEHRALLLRADCSG